MSLRQKLIQNSSIKHTASLTESKVFGTKEMITTAVPMINVAFSGEIDGGFTPGLTMIAGPSKNFKSGFSLLMIKSFLNKHPDGAVLFYDSEFGTPESYFDSFEIDKDAVIHKSLYLLKIIKKTDATANPRTTAPPPVPP